MAYAAAQEAPATASAPAYDHKKLSETFGHIIIKHLQQTNLQFDIDSVAQGMRDAVAGKSAPLSEKEYEEIMAEVQEKGWQDLAAKNLKEAEVFLEQNRKNKDVVELEKGKLQYQVLQSGQGAAVVEHAIPTLIYTGKFLDGSVFSSSQDKAMTIPLDQAIRGFSLGMVGMKEGEKRRLFIHPELAYGTAGSLPPNSLLIFDLEVVKAASNVQVQPSLKDGADKAPSLKDVVQ
jgi:peptidylprolyl isomerase